MAIRAIRDSGGRGVKISDQEIIEAIPKLARETGVFVEPAAAATYAGFLRLCERGALESDQRVILVLTGNGLKDIDSARKAIGEPLHVAPDIDVDELKRQIAV